MNWLQLEANVVMGNENDFLHFHTMEACIRSTLNFRSILDTPYVNGIAIRDFGKDF